MKFTGLSLVLASLAAALPSDVAEASNPNIPESWKRSMEKNLEFVRRSSQLNDVDILNFALTLEHLEDTFYREGLDMFADSDFEAAGYTARTRSNIGEISSDETTHVKFLTAALGDSAVPACKYNFGITDVVSFIETAAILEGVGITAYLGAAALIADPGYLTAAGSILTVESRHSAYLRTAQPHHQTPFPQPFDVPLDPMEVYTLASLFITSCPKKANLGFTRFPYLSLKPGQKSPLRQKMWVVLNLEKGTTVTSGKVYAAFLYVTGPIFTPVTVVPAKKGRQVRVLIPEPVAGQSFVVLTSSNSTVSDDTIIAGPAIVAVQAPYRYLS